jgi:uncharacterized phage protein (TIGR01671 family)
VKEIKFRAWDKAENCMAGPADNLYVDFNHGKCWIKNFEDNLIEEVDFILMQFTGLKDKNGKEIYEGDYINTEGGTFEVVWYDQGACFRYMDGHGNMESPLNYDHLEVTSNIYELLKS